MASLIEKEANASIELKLLTVAKIADDRPENVLYNS